ncbi:hypothetical protein DAETH_45920 (plasmid) [Deinococcus aetherius]|uniref:PepSY domain-containing protein n=1 Tax=Deinococcus aetherius TaxID=200252 RepID=A0ABM8ALC5_9DEIO|nr:PepSY domain-containing protein [Deinococcus aetherius]BDP44623.1 hypothetical protein DAETH_45920 [Deinococcus aetherius]
MRKNVKTVLLTLTALTAVGLPLAGHAFAQGKAPSAQVAQGGQASQDAETNDDQGGAVRGSIQLPADTQGTEVPDAQKEAQYRSLAKITPAQAQQAAQAAVPGTVTSVKLEDQDGSLVYAVVIGQTEVAVDAGNGQVLRQEAAGQDQGADQEMGGQEGGETGESGTN